eukprot:CAMPEP_0168344142 /NCGR_PEP_ID=MMETSP0213-20121227/16621_1 /TAXON_ID=151035 /ORGANISM="Euplotes harpa, Strain FSP1.4" /LENGTH=80 /DNA_ID=CAMNT_0008351789 /DNA_START=340 /DNA_END=582 /DNA_ORIENTATION=+
MCRYTGRKDIGEREQKELTGFGRTEGKDEDEGKGKESMYVVEAKEMEGCRREFKELCRCAQGVTKYDAFGVKEEFNTCPE